ncbi:STAS domain-containing protein [Streptomyces sp. SID13031]|uniref:STAS domain-containing protein n=1 Tax=Streptomyces sp. SID13031 TaxID=2706046 RepID=UPI0013C89D4F|nr:STAS domain-containing protein [Streptomyces sp. SID13031]
MTLAGNNTNQHTAPTITRRQVGDWTIVEIKGPLNWPYAVRLAKQLKPCAGEDSSRFQLDLLGVTSLDHTAIAIIASTAAHLAARQTELRIIATRAQRRRLPRTAGMHHIQVRGPD